MAQYILTPGPRVGVASLDGVGLFVAAGQNPRPPIPDGWSRAITASLGHRISVEEVINPLLLATVGTPLVMDSPDPDGRRLVFAAAHRRMASPPTPIPAEVATHFGWERGSVEITDPTHAAVTIRTKERVVVGLSLETDGELRVWGFDILIA